MKTKTKTETRTCYCCKKVLPLKDFKKDKNKSSGRSYLCRKCNTVKNKEKYRLDPQTKIAEKLRAQMRRLITNRHIVKNSNVAKYFGCSIGEFLRYIESKFQEGMNWENRGYDGWHLDHVVPCSHFDLTKEEEIKKCFHYTNIQPLWKDQNLTKGTRILQAVDESQIFWSPTEESKRGPIMGPNIFEEF